MTDRSPNEPQNVDVEIFHRRITVSMEKLTPAEIIDLANVVNDKMAEMSEGNPHVADTSKLALLAALDLAAEMHTLKRRFSGAGRMIRAAAHVPELEEIVRWLETTDGMIDKLLLVAKECSRPRSRKKNKRIRR
jgi:cell division protein ZapA (FtsZ GTPase activity inhibitor)